MASEVIQWREVSRVIRSRIDISALKFTIVSGDFVKTLEADQSGIITGYGAISKVSGRMISLAKISLEAH